MTNEQPRPLTPNELVHELDLDRGRSPEVMVEILENWLQQHLAEAAHSATLFALRAASNAFVASAQALDRVLAGENRYAVSIPRSKVENFKAQLITEAKKHDPRNLRENDKKTNSKTDREGSGEGSSEDSDSPVLIVSG